MSWLTRKCGLLEGDVATKGKHRAWSSLRKRGQKKRESSWASKEPTEEKIMHAQGIRRQSLSKGRVRWLEYETRKMSLSSRNPLLRFWPQVKEINPE